MKIVEINTEHAHQWDNYVQQHESHSPYHLYAWLQAVSKAYHHKVCYLAAFENEKIIGILPFAIITIPFLKSSYCSLPFCDVGGALADSQEVKIALENAAYERQTTPASQVFELREQTTEMGSNEDLVNKKVRMLMALPETSDELMASFKSKLRSQIRKAEKNKLTYEYGISQQCIDDFYVVFSENMRRLGSPVHSKEWFAMVCKYYQDNCTFAVVKFENKVVAAGLILFTQDKVSIPWASTRADFNHLSPNMLLYWVLLKYSVDYGCKEFDFGRSTYGEGTYKFKKQWGALPKLLNWRILNGTITQSQASENASTSSLRSHVENIWKKLPLSITNTLGPKIRKYITL